MRRSFGFPLRVVSVATVLTATAVLGSAPVSRGDLASHAQDLQQGIAADNGKIGTYRGRLRDLESRLAGIESSLAIQQGLLLKIQGQLTAARARLVTLRAELVHDRSALAAQLVSQYESPSPDVVGVVMEANGFSDLLNRVDEMRTLASTNAKILGRVASDRTRVALEAASLAQEQTRQQRVTASIRVERDQVASLRESVLQQETAAFHDRARKQAALKQAQHQLAVLAARERAAFAPSGGVAASGAYGFFPAPGTNYSVGQEPEIAARLDRLGKALGLHLIGLSGYRSPEHSVEVGGFADDPHTRGEASDTPGVEGVPEATLLKFGLTRPFGGAAEADHIQLA
jgi:peptidoglycan hydrolase CwlO-like protein